MSDPNLKQPNRTNPSPGGDSRNESRSHRRDDRKAERRQRKQARQIFYQDVHYNLKNSSFQRKLVAFGKLLILLLIMVGIPVMLFIFARGTLLNREAWSSLPATLAKHKVSSFLVLIVLQMLQIVVCVLPGQPIQFASSYLYGIWGGLAIALIGAVIGCIITYRLANFLGSDAMHLLFGEQRVKDYMHKLNSGRALTIVFLIYLIPGIPKDLVSYVAGISDIKLRPFLLVSTVGRTPGLMESLLIGMFWASRNYVGVAIVVLVTLAILYVCFKFREKIMNRLSSYEDPEE